MNKNIFRALALLSLPASASATTFAEAKQVYLSHDVTRAEALYRQIAADPKASPGDRASASRELGRIAWLVDGDHLRATSIIERSLPTDPEPCAAALLLGRILNEGERPDLVPAKLAPFDPACVELEPRLALQIARSHTLAVARKRPGARTASLAAARAYLAGMDPLTRTTLDSARYRMRIGLLAGDSEEALAGWRDYFLLGSRSAPQAFGGSDAQVIATFRAGTPRIAAKADAMRLATLLARAGFADEVRLIASDKGLSTATGALAREWDLIRRYLTLRDGLAAAALTHDRRYARTRQDDADAYRAEVSRVIGEAVKGLGKAGQKPMEVLYDRWGLFGTEVGDTGGVMSQHLGHAIEDDRREIVQGNRRGKIRFINVDNMIVNSFVGWLPDGEQAPSGWATGGDTIIQVRPLYVDGTLSRLAPSKPGPARDRFVQRMEQAEAEDRKLHAGGKIVYLLGMARRLRLQGIDAIAAEVRATPGEGTYEQRFISTWLDRETFCSITLHEGRHILDQAEFTGENKLDGVELEYRAKLSDLSMCPSPRITIGTIIGPGDDPHGQANRRILTAFDSWISENREQVAGFDPAVPGYAQLWKLTDAQLRTVALVLDREVQGKGGAK
ncbi:MAG TPA: hypothetical protein VGB70_06965 [Allosphingosinicella sp.]